VLINGDGNDNAASNTAVASSGKLTYTDLVNFWNLFDPYELNTIIAAPAQVAQQLGITEFRDAAAGLNFHADGRSYNLPSGRDILSKGTSLVSPADGEEVSTVVRTDRRLAARP